MKCLERYLLVGLLLLCATVLTACGGNNEANLRGTWVCQQGVDDEIPTSIEFTRNGFSVTQRDETQIGEPTRAISFVDTRSTGVTRSRFWGSARQRGDLTFIREVDFPGVTVYWPDGRPRGISNDWSVRIYRNVATGTYSITDDRIEFIFSDGTIEVFTFSHTENTLSFGGFTFIRR